MRIDGSQEYHILREEIERLTAENHRLREQSCSAGAGPTAMRDERDVIFDSVGAGILVLDAAGRIFSSNRKMRELFQLQEQSILGRSCREVVCRGNDCGPICIFEQILRNGQGEARTDWVFEERCFEVVGTPVCNACGEIVKVVLVYTEVTDRKRAEQALHRSLLEADEARQRVDAILRSVADGLLVSDPSGRIMLMNPAAETMLGRAFREVAGRSLEAALEVPGLPESIEHALRMQDPFELVVPATEAFPQRILRGHVSVVRSRQGQAGGRILILHDVTREREMETMKREFVSTAGHELQTPLTAIVGFSELLLDQEDLPGETRRECLTFIMEKGEALSALVDRLLDINRLDSGRPLALTPEPLALQQLIDSALERFAVAEKTRCSVQLPAEEIVLRGDREKMTRTLESLISNALKFSPPENPVEISGEIHSSGVRVAVRDRGIGMTAEQSERIFETFYRGDCSNTSLGGAGLGMCLVRHVVEAHGGTIEIESAPGAGTLVTLLLPEEGSQAA